MKTSKCPKTISGKHIWKGEYIPSHIVERLVGSSSWTMKVNVETQYPKCKACGMIDDSIKKK